LFSNDSQEGKRRGTKENIQLLRIKILTFAGDFLGGLILPRLHAWDAG